MTYRKVSHYFSNVTAAISTYILYYFKGFDKWTRLWKLNHLLSSNNKPVFHTKINMLLELKKIKKQCRYLVCLGISTRGPPQMSLMGTGSEFTSAAQTCDSNIWKCLMGWRTGAWWLRTVDDVINHLTKSFLQTPSAQLWYSQNNNVYITINYIFIILNDVNVSVGNQTVGFACLIVYEH